MVTVNKKVCPCCGQAINNREVTLYSGMVKALLRVYYWCKKNGKYEFTRKEIKQLFKGVDNEIARWGDWILFGNGMVYRPGHMRGHWGLNLSLVGEFIQKRRTIPTRVVIDRESGDVYKYDYKYIDQVPNLKEFLDEAGEYIVKYADSE